MGSTLMTAVLLPSLLSASPAAEVKAPRIWDEQALRDWSAPVAALGIRPGHFSAAEYYGTPEENLRTYPVYRPDREPAGYWQWLQQQKPEPLIDKAALHTREDWIRAGEKTFRELADPFIRTGNPETIRD